jgi:hypothetical protein
MVTIKVNRRKYGDAVQTSVTIPAAIARTLPDDSNLWLQIEVTPEGILLRPLKMVPA